mgnify:FL=1
MFDSVGLVQFWLAEDMILNISVLMPASNGVRKKVVSASEYLHTKNPLAFTLRSAWSVFSIARLGPLLCVVQ